MKTVKEELQRKLEVFKQIQSNMKEFESLSKDYLGTPEMSYNNIDIRLLNFITDKYAYGDLIFDNGDVYCVIDRIEPTVYEKTIGVRNFVAQRVKWDLSLSDEVYDIKEEAIVDREGFVEMSTYTITKKG